MATKKKSNNGVNRIKKVLEKEKDVLVIPSIDLRIMQMCIIGDTPLLCHRFSPKALEDIDDKDQMKPKKGRGPRKPEEEFEDCLYPINKDGELQRNGKLYGFPASGVKKTAVNAVRYVDGMTLVTTVGMFHVLGDYTKINSGVPIMRRDTAKNKMGNAIIVTRAQFTDWNMVFKIQYNASIISPEQIGKLYDLAGFHVGLGAWRPSNAGSMGRFHVATKEEIK